VKVAVRNFTGLTFEISNVSVQRQQSAASIRPTTCRRFSIPNVVSSPADVQIPLFVSGDAGILKIIISTFKCYRLPNWLTADRQLDIMQRKLSLLAAPEMS
jgi:hypothetical protein